MQLRFGWLRGVHYPNFSRQTSYLARVGYVIHVTIQRVDAVQHPLCYSVLLAVFKLPYLLQWVDK